MSATSLIRRNASDLQAGQLHVDLETRATKDDHQALRLWLRLLSCTVRIENYVRTGFRQEFSTTLPRFDLMAQLERYPEGLRMSDLSKHLMVSGGNVTGITDQLENEGLVVRTFDRGDRRAITVKLTPSGLKRFREMATSHERWVVELLGGLSQEDKHAMLATLGKLKSHLHEALPSAAGRKRPSAARKK
jgi:DNA-binding MarR family transcriptional regulator